MSITIESTVSERCNRHIRLIRKALRVACIQALSVTIAVGMLTYQAQTARLGLYIHPLESALRAAGVKETPQVNAVIWTGFQPSIPPTMGDLKARAQAVLHAYAPGQGAVLYSASDASSSFVRYTGKQDKDTTFEITTRYEKSSSLQLPGAILVTLEVEGLETRELRAAESDWRKAVQRGALHPWSKVDTWLTLSGRVRATLGAETTSKLALAAGGGTGAAASVQLDKGIVRRGFSPLLAPAWRLGDELTNIEIRVERLYSHNGDIWVQVGSPFVMPVQKSDTRVATTINRIKVGQG